MEETKEENIRLKSGVAGSSLGLVYTTRILGASPGLTCEQKIAHGHSLRQQEPHGFFFLRVSFLSNFVFTGYSQLHHRS